MLGHATADAGAVNLGDVDVVLLRDAPDERRGLLPLGLVASVERAGTIRPVVVATPEPASAEA